MEVPKGEHTLVVKRSVILKHRVSGKNFLVTDFRVQGHDGAKVGDEIEEGDQICDTNGELYALGSIASLAKFKADREQDPRDDYYRTIQKGIERIMDEISDTVSRLRSEGVWEEVYIPEEETA